MQLCDPFAVIGGSVHCIDGMPKDWEALLSAFLLQEVVKLGSFTTLLFDLVGSRLGP